MSLTVFCTLVFRVVTVSIKNAGVPTPLLRSTLYLAQLVEHWTRWETRCHGFLVSKCRRFDSASGDILFAPAAFLHVASVDNQRAGCKHIVPKVHFRLQVV